MKNFILVFCLLVFCKVGHAGLSYFDSGEFNSIIQDNSQKAQQQEQAIAEKIQERKIATVSMDEGEVIATKKAHPVVVPSEDIQVNEPDNVVEQIIHDDDVSK